MANTYNKGGAAVKGGASLLYEEVNQALAKFRQNSVEGPHSFGVVSYGDTKNNDMKAKAGYFDRKLGEFLELMLQNSDQGDIVEPPEPPTNGLTLSVGKNVLDRDYEYIRFTADLHIPDRRAYIKGDVVMVYEREPMNLSMESPKRNFILLRSFGDDPEAQRAYDCWKVELGVVKGKESGSHWNNPVTGNLLTLDISLAADTCAAVIENETFGKRTVSHTAPAYSVGALRYVELAESPFWEWSNIKVLESR